MLICLKCDMDRLNFSRFGQLNFSRYSSHSDGRAPRAMSHISVESIVTVVFVGGYRCYEQLDGLPGISPGEPHRFHTNNLTLHKLKRLIKWVSVCPASAAHRSVERGAGPLLTTSHFTQGRLPFTTSMGDNHPDNGLTVNQLLYSLREKIASIVFVGSLPTLTIHLTPHQPTQAS